MRNTDCRSWNMARKLKNVKIQKHTLQDMKYGKKHCKTWKMRNLHCRTWTMARKLKIMENEKHTPQDVKYVEKH